MIVGRNRVLGALLVAFPVAGCGNFVESDDGQGFATLDERGGRVTFRSLTAHALDRTTTFEVRLDPISGDPLVGEAYHVRPDDHAFALPAHLSLTFDPAVGGHAEELYLAQHHADGWHALDGRVLEPGRVSGTSPVTGTFGLIRCAGGACMHQGP